MTRPGATRAELQAWMKMNGASEIMHPSSIVVLDAIPLLGPGKINYVALAKALSDSGASALTGTRKRLVSTTRPCEASMYRRPKTIRRRFRMREGRHSCILIGHNIHQVFQVVDRIAVMRRGRIVADDIDPKQTTVAEVEAVITGELADPAH